MTTWTQSPLFARYHADKWAFFAVFVLGALAVIGLDFVHQAKLSAVIVCIVLLFLYAFAALNIPALRLRPDQAADNCYYLGLLFTLTSLGVALFRFSTADAAAESILRNFGVAIFTTIVGLGLRVFISQFREDPDDLEYEAKAALSETVRKLRGELDQSVAEMQSFAIGTRQAMQEVSEAANKSTLETLAHAVGRFESAADDMGKRFEASATAFESRTGAFDVSLDKVAGAVEALTERISAVRADASLVEDRLQPVFDALQRSLGEFAETFEVEQARVKKSLASLARAGESLQSFDESSASIARSSEQLSQAAVSLGSGADMAARLDEATRSASTAAASFGAALDAAAADQAIRGREVIDELARSTEQLREHALASLARVDGASQQVAASLAGVNSEFSQSSEAVQRVRRELAELAGWIIERLDRK